MHHKNIYFCLLVIGLINASCIKGKTSGSELTSKINTENREALSSSVSNIDISNNKLTITGSGFERVTQVNLKSKSFNESFQIDSLTDSTIVASSKKHLSLLVGKTFDLVLSNASAATSYTVTFSLSDYSITASKLNSMGATSGQVLSFNGTNWIPSDLNGLNYLGTWNANTNSPALTDSCATSGDYYIVGTSGTTTINGVSTWATTDWLVCQSTSGWQKITHTSGVVTFNGRQGTVVPMANDYTWPMLDMTNSKLEDIEDINITGRTDGQVLKWNSATSKWVASDDLTTATNTVATASIQDNAVTSAKIAAGTIVNSDISASAAIDYTKLNIPSSSIPYAKLSLSDGDIPYAKINIPDASITTAKITGFTFTNYLPLAGGSMTGTVAMTAGSTITGLSNLPLTDSEATSKYYVVNNYEPKLTAGSAGQYYRGDKTWASLNTDNVTEGSNYYFTEARTLNTDLSGLSTLSDATIASSDTILSALGKLQAQLTNFSSVQTALTGLSLVSTDQITSSDTILTALGKLQAQISNQWTYSSNNLYYTNGNIGIGTSSPTSQLDVQDSDDQVSINIQNNNSTSAQYPGLWIANYLGTAGGGFPEIVFSNMGGNSTTTTATANSKYLGNIAFNGNGTTTYVRGAGIFAKSAEIFTDTSAATDIYFATSGVGEVYPTNKMIIKNTGKVGLGTTSPNVDLDVYGSNGIRTLNENGSALIYLQSYREAGNQNKIIARGTRGTLSSPSQSQSGDNALEIIGYGYDGVSYQEYSRIILGSESSAPTSSSSPGFIDLRTTPSGSVSDLSRLYIQNDGDVGVGTSAPNYKLDVNGTINASGNVQGITFVATSDQRFKKNIKTLDFSLEKILSLRGVEYDWRVDEFVDRHFNVKHQIGVIAQEVEKVFPNLVETDKKGYKSVNYTALVAPIIEAIKSLYEKIITIERKLASKAEKSELEQVKAENAELKKYLCQKDPHAPFCRKK